MRLTARMNINSTEASPSATVQVRRFRNDDSVEQLTLLLHRAYADHAAAGRVFFASYQNPQDTQHRLSKGECWVAMNGNALVGTVTVSAPHTNPAGYPAPAGGARSGNWLSSHRKEALASDSDCWPWQSHVSLLSDRHRSSSIPLHRQQTSSTGTAGAATRLSALGGGTSPTTTASSS